jgi:hypothetical protein
LGRARTVREFGVAKDPEKTIFRKRAGRPSLFHRLRKEGNGTGMMHVIRIRKRNQDIDVEQKHGSS